MEESETSRQSEAAPGRYLIGIRDPADPKQEAAFRSCKAMLASLAERDVPSGVGRLVVTLDAAQARRLRQLFGDTLVIEPDGELRDPRMFPSPPF